MSPAPSIVPAVKERPAILAALLNVTVPVETESVSLMVMPEVAVKTAEPTAVMPPVVASIVRVPPELRVTPEVIEMLSVPSEELLASPSKVILPVEVRSPLIVSPLSALAVKFPPSVVEVARIRVALSKICTAPVPDARVTAPVKSLEVLVKVIVPVLALVSKLEAPPMVKAAVCEILPEDVTEMSPVTFTVSLKATLPKALMTRAVEELLVVVNWRSVLLVAFVPTALNVIVPLPASMEVPLDIWITSKLFPSVVTSLAVMDTFPAPLAVILPPELILTASSAVSVTAPADVIANAALILISENCPLASRIREPAARVLEKLIALPVPVSLFVREKLPVPTSIAPEVVIDPVSVFRLKFKAVDESTTKVVMSPPDAANEKVVSPVEESA